MRYLPLILILLCVPAKTQPQVTYDFMEGFQMRREYRRDWSSTDYFNTSEPNDLGGHQDTALAGLIWWFGGKRGMW